MCICECLIQLGKQFSRRCKSNSEADTYIYNTGAREHTAHQPFESAKMLAIENYAPLRLQITFAHTHSKNLIWRISLCLPLPSKYGFIPCGHTFRESEFSNTHILTYTARLTWLYRTILV